MVWSSIGKIDKKFIKYSGAPQVQGIDLTDDGRSVAVLPRYRMLF